MKSPLLDLKAPGPCLCRAMVGLTEELAEDLRALPEQADERIHDVRVRLKIIRSLLRLVQSQVAPARLAAVKENIVSIKDAFADYRDEGVVRKWLANFAAKNTKMRHRLGLAAARGNPPEVSEGIFRAVVDLRRNLQSLEMDRAAADDLSEACGEAYRRARKRWREARKDASDEFMHEWRKRVKDLLYQVEALDDMSLLKKLPSEVGKLADVLGDYHDLSLISARMTDRGEARLRRRIQSRKNDLSRHAQALGKKLFRRKPSAFVKKLRAKK